MNSKDLIPGQRIRVTGGPRGLDWIGRTGTVVDIPTQLLNQHDAAVEFDDDNRIGCICAHEVEAIQ